MSQSKLVFGLFLAWGLSAALLAQPNITVAPADAGTPSRSPSPVGATLPAGTPSASPLPLAPSGGKAMIGGDVIRGGVRVPVKKTTVKVRRR